MYQDRETDIRTSYEKEYRCPECHDSGFICVEEATPDSIALYGNYTPISIAKKCPYCNGGHEIRAQEIRSRADIPQAFYDKRMNDFKWDIYKKPNGEDIDLSTHKKYVDSFIENFSEWEKQGLGLYIWSSMRGTGKTYLASCICNELISRYPMGTKFVSANKLIDIAKSGNRNSRDEYEQDPIELLCKCKLLVIDDLGQKASGTEWMNDILFRILDSRLLSKSVTIVTSNIKLEALDMDDRIVDRLYKMCQSIPIPDYAVRQKEANAERVDFLRRMGLTTRKETA